MERIFSNHAKTVLGYSREEAVRLQNHDILPDHLLLGIIRDGEGKAMEAISGFLSMLANYYDKDRKGELKLDD